MRPGYEDAHSIDNDLAFLQASLAEFPDADVYSLSESVNLGLFVPPGQEITDRPTMSPATTPNLGEPKERTAVVDSRGRGRPGRSPSARRGTPGCRRPSTGAGAPTSPWSPGPNYHHGIRALANSLRRVSSIPLLALCTPDADQAALTASGIHVIEVPEIVNPNRIRRMQSPVRRDLHQAQRLPAGLPGPAGLPRRRHRGAEEHRRPVRRGRLRRRARRRPGPGQRADLQLRGVRGHPVPRAVPLPARPAREHRLLRRRRPGLPEQHLPRLATAAAGVQHHQADVRPPPGAVQRRGGQGAALRRGQAVGAGQAGQPATTSWTCAGWSSSRTGSSAS